MSKKSLLKYTYLSIFASILTIILKFIAYFFTASVGFLSDAIESLVNLATAIFAYFSLKIAQKPADTNHPYGHSKAEYFSSIIEGLLIFLASFSIIASSIDRIIHPKNIEQVFLGIIISAAAALINLLVGQKLIAVGKKQRSIALEADGHHLLTDAYTSVGVIMAVFLVEKTGILILDPLVAIFVSLNILFTGKDLIKRSISGFMDEAISEKEIKIIEKIFQSFKKQQIVFHSLKTRQSAQKRFISFHILFPNHWSIKKAHDLADKIEKQIKKKLENAEVESHLEPINDKKSFEN